MAQFRGVEFGQLLYGGDNLGSDVWDHRDWNSHLTGREKLFWLAAEACLTLQDRAAVLLRWRRGTKTYGKRRLMETFVSSRGGRLWSVSEGEGVPILILNGGPGCCDYLQPIADMLIGQAQVIRFEQSGCGRSEDTPPYDIDACLSDIESIRRHYGVEQWIVGGHSWGADLALIYALQYPERVLGFLCLSGGRFHNDREWHRLYEERRGLEVPPKFDYPPNMEVNRQGNASWKGYIQRPSVWRDLSRLNRPGLFLYGEQDIRPSWPVEQVAALLPSAEFHMIEGADHFLWTSHAEQVKARVCDFIARLEKG